VGLLAQGSPSPKPRALPLTRLSSHNVAAIKVFGRAFFKKLAEFGTESQGFNLFLF